MKVGNNEIENKSITKEKLADEVVNEFSTSTDNKITLSSQVGDTKTNVHDALVAINKKADEAFQSASNGKTSIAGKTGTVNSSSTFDQIANEIQTCKNTMATNLVNKKVNAANSETLRSLSNKINQIQVGISNTEMKDHPGRVKIVVEQISHNITNDTNPTASIDTGFKIEQRNGYIWVYIEGETTYPTLQYDTNLNLVNKYQGLLVGYLADGTEVKINRYKNRMLWYNNVSIDLYSKTSDSWEFGGIDKSNGNILFIYNKSFIVFDRNMTKISNGTVSVKLSSTIFGSNCIYNKYSSNYYKYDIGTGTNSTITEDEFNAAKTLGLCGHASSYTDALTEGRNVIDSEGYNWKVETASTGNGNGVQYMNRFQNGISTYGMFFGCQARVPQILFYNGYLYLIQQRQNFYNGMTITRMKLYYKYS